jgi:hypothetical protein
MHCPTCGAKLRADEHINGTEKQHRCNPARLASIDRSLKSERDKTPEPTLGDRLEIADLMMHLNETVSEWNPSVGKYIYERDDHAD